jgi:hypothetical protein
MLREPGRVDQRLNLRLPPPSCIGQQFDRLTQQFERLQLGVVANDVLAGVHDQPRLRRCAARSAAKRRALSRSTTRVPSASLSAAINPASTARRVFDSEIPMIRAASAT